MRRRKGACTALPSSWGSNNSATAPSGIGACSTPKETAGVATRPIFFCTYAGSIGTGGGGALKGRKDLASSSTLMLVCEVPISKPCPLAAPSSCFTTEARVNITSWALLFGLRGAKMASNDFWLSWAGMGWFKDMGRCCAKSEARETTARNVSTISVSYTTWSIPLGSMCPVDGTLGGWTPLSLTLSADCFVLEASFEALLLETLFLPLPASA